MIVSRAKPNVRTPEGLISDCLSGGKSAWDDLVDQYGRLVYSIARRCGLSGPDADDVFQNVFTSLHRHMSSIREPSRLSAWLIRTTHRECWRLNRHRGNECALSDRWADAAEPPADLAALWERQHIVREAMNRLSARDRELMQMLFLESPTKDYETIADRLHMKIGSIGPTRARCFKKLERILIDLGFDVTECVSQTRGSNGGPSQPAKATAPISLN